MLITSLKLQGAARARAAPRGSPSTVRSGARTLRPPPCVSGKCHGLLVLLPLRKLILLCGLLQEGRMREQVVTGAAHTALCLGDLVPGPPTNAWQPQGHPQHRHQWRTQGCQEGRLLPE